MSRRTGRCLDRQAIFQGRDHLSPHRRETPWRLQPRLAVAGVPPRRRSYADDATRPRATIRSARRGKVQRGRHPRAARPASAIRRACAYSSSVGGVPGRGPSSNAPRSSATQRGRGRSTRRLPDAKGGSPGAIVPALCRGEPHAGAAHRARGRRPAVPYVFEWGTYIVTTRHERWFPGPRWSSSCGEHNQT